MITLARFGRALLGAALLTLFLPARADRIQLDNGDQVTGTVLEQNIDQLIVETAWGGKITIKRSEVTRLFTETPRRIELQDGRSLDGTLQSQADGSLIVTTPDARIALAGLAAITAITAIPDSTPPAWTWRGNVTVGGELKAGNTQTDKFNASTRLVAEKKEQQRVTLAASLNRELNANQLTKEQYRASGKYDRFFHKRWYGYAGASFEQDKFKDIDLRSIFSAGSGYQFFDTDALRLSLEAGLSYTDTRFVVDEDDTYAGFNWGLNWEQQLLDGRVSFFHRHQGNQGLDAADNTLINAQTGVRVPVAKGLTASAEYDLDWNRSPPDNTNSTDHTWLLGIGYDW
ncbi:MAG TPA: DUF481 domain-containing protein [Gammaproteobacteria bacterium]|nr:DUF481 domain-containing protein [Gammaproteobacteria bacterium]